MREHVFIFVLTSEIRFSLHSPRMPNHRPLAKIDSNFHFHNAFNEAIEDTYDKDHRSIHQ